jgi:hypothetical protein
MVGVMVSRGSGEMMREHSNKIVIMLGDDVTDLLPRYQSTSHVWVLHTPTNETAIRRARASLPGSSLTIGRYPNLRNLGEQLEGMLDEAIEHHGRADSIVVCGYPTASEVDALLRERGYCIVESDVAREYVPCNANVRSSCE